MTWTKILQKNNVTFDKRFKKPKENVEPKEIDDITETFEGIESEKLEQGKKQTVRNDSETRTTTTYLFVYKYCDLEIVANDMMSNWHGRGGILANI